MILKHNRVMGGPIYAWCLPHYCAIYLLPDICIHFTLLLRKFKKSARDCWFKEYCLISARHSSRVRAPQSPQVSGWPRFFFYCRTSRRGFMHKGRRSSCHGRDKNKQTRESHLYFINSKKKR